MLKKDKILLIEDDEFVSKAYRFFLMKAGYDVTMVNTAKDGKKMMKEGKHDLILLDLIMPGMNGFELLAELKERGISEKVPVIIISNLGQEADIAKCKKLGAVDYLVKANFYMKDVIKKVKHHIERGVVAVEQ